jgi:hypothetical protein
MTFSRASLPLVVVWILLLGGCATRQVNPPIAKYDPGSLHQFQQNGIGANSNCFLWRRHARGRILIRGSRNVAEHTSYHQNNPLRPVCSTRST